MLGKFVVFEGGECVGKTTQIRLLAEALTKKGYAAVVTKEPGGGGDEALKIREKLLKGGLSQKEEIDLFIKSRKIHVDNLVRPELQRGSIVLCDRFSDSTFAYQCYGRNLGVEYAQMQDAAARGGIAPDLVIVFDMPVEKALARLEHRKEAKGEVSAFDLEEKSFHERIRGGFLALAKAFARNHVVVEADRPVPDVAAEVERIVSARLGL
ncbi:MAG: dTMP kinase [Candidatus Ryanbacteria bacterium]|nr:dTMP kinase [Candidatus Ryanbacteria bacterium]